MDNTELHYLTYDPDEIWAEMQRVYVENGGDILYPGDEKEMLLRAVQADIVQVFAGVDNALRMQTLRYAIGTYLDVIGEKIGCERITASPATAMVRIVANVTGHITVIEAGTQLTADGELFFELDEDLTLSGYAESKVVSITCTRDGVIGNTLAVDTAMEFVQITVATSNAIDSITVTTAGHGGNEQEEDDEYRERIRLSGIASVTTGTSDQYKSVAMAVSSEIQDAAALNGGSGIVNVYLIINDEDSAASIIQDVTDTLSATDVRPLTDSVYVYQAEDVAYTLNVEITADGSSSVTTAIAQAVSDYQEWQDNTIGRAFNPDRLMAAIYQAGAMRVVWGTGSEGPGGGTVEYTEIDPDQRCKGTISLTYIDS